MKKLILLLCLLPLLVTGQETITNAHYRIYSVKLHKEVSLAEIAADMDNADVLFYGEEHNDSVTHYLEEKMLQELHKRFGSKVMLSMEMFDRDVQPVVDEYLKGYIKDVHFLKDARVWSNFRDYKPTFVFAKNNNLGVVCANAPKRYSSLAGRRGQETLKELPADSKRFFAPLPYDTATGAYHEKLSTLGQHGNPTADTTKAVAPPMNWMGNFSLVTAQSLWDATMGWSIASALKANKGAKVLQINGRFHSDEGFAVVSQLKKYSPKTKTLVISAFRDDSFPAINWAQFQKQGDYIIVTDPKVPPTYME